MSTPSGNHLEQIPQARWETVKGRSERFDEHHLKITVEGRTHVDRELPSTQRVGATVIVDERRPYDYQHKMRKLVRLLERLWIV